MKSAHSALRPARPAARFFDTDIRLAAAAVVALATVLGLHGRIPTELRIAAGWDAFAAASLLLAWIVIAKQDPYEVRRHARLQDSSRTLLFVAVILAALASLLAVGLLLAAAKTAPTRLRSTSISVSIAAVVLSWALVHTLFALRYAHRYYDGADEGGRETVARGVLFPGKEDPDYLDFAYFSFVIGMTCQVSDVQISSRRIRRLALLHGLIAFGFNAAILALAVNIVANLVQ
jgi:uncharacterized membrane protein